VCNCRGMTSSLVKSVDDSCNGAEQRVASGPLPDGLRKPLKVIETRA
jgi:hypothetical protein